MSSRVIEAFLPGPAAPRAVEPASRAADEGNGFRPALNQALHADARAAAQPGDANASDEDLPTPEADATDETADVADGALDDLAHDEAAVATDDSHDADNDETNADDQELAATGAAVLVVVAPPVEPTLTTSDGDGAALTASAAAPTTAPADAPGEAAANRPTLPASAALPHDGAESPDAESQNERIAAPSLGAAATLDESPAVATTEEHGGDDDSDARTALSESTAAGAAEPPTEQRNEDDFSEAPEDAAPQRDGLLAADASSDEISPPRVATADAAASVLPDGSESAPTDAPADGPAPIAHGSTPPATDGAAARARLTPERTLQPAAPRGEPESPEVIDRGRFLGRVEGAIRTAQQRDGRVQVRLSPPELGSLRIDLTIEQGVLSARLEAETPAARKLLLDNLPALRERLAQQDVRVDRFDVDVRREGGGSSGGPQDRPTGDRTPHEGDERRERAAARHAATARTSHAPTMRTTPNTALDVRV